MSSYDILKLSELIKKNIPKERINLVAEIREPRFRGGHLYLTLKDNHGYINGIVWKSNITDEIKNLKEGCEVDVTGNLNFYQNKCTLSFVINKLNSQIGKGELMKEYENVFKKYNDKGFFLQSKKLKPPDLIKKY